MPIVVTQISVTRKEEVQTIDTLAKEGSDFEQVDVLTGTVCNNGCGQTISKPRAFTSPRGAICDTCFRSLPNLRDIGRRFFETPPTERSYG